jgi:hypothetical protein
MGATFRTSREAAAARVSDNFVLFEQMMSTQMDSLNETLEEFKAMSETTPGGEFDWIISQLARVKSNLPRTAPSPLVDMPSKATEAIERIIAAARVQRDCLVGPGSMSRQDAEYSFKFNINRAGSIMSELQRRSESAEKEFVVSSRVARRQVRITN